MRISRTGGDPNASLPPPTQARGGDSFPDITVYSHTGDKFRLQQDLAFGRVVVINFMTILQHPLFPATDHLLPLAARLGARLGNDVMFLSVSMDPESDTPLALRDFARDYDIPPGWLFLTAAAEDVEALSRRLFKTKALCGFRWGHPARLLHYGNAAAGLWGTCAADDEIDLVMARLSWVGFGSVNSGRARRAGPRALQPASQVTAEAEAYVASFSEP